MYTWLKRFLTGDYSLLFGIGLWHLRKARNDIMFNGVRADAKALAHKVRAWSETTASALSRDARILDCQAEREWDNIVWEPSPPDRVTTNIDGSVDSRRYATAGGVIRRSDGGCLSAFSLNLG
ncbi:hypothetical protein LINPERPRIM_LOCUS18767 [Linum perenne]